MAIYAVHFCGFLWSQILMSIQKVLIDKRPPSLHPINLLLSFCKTTSVSPVPFKMPPIKWQLSITCKSITRQTSELTGRGYAALGVLSHRRMSDQIEALLVAFVDD
jgi:hypothetical protein